MKICTPPPSTREFPADGMIVQARSQCTGRWYTRGPQLSTMYELQRYAPEYEMRSPQV